MALSRTLQVALMLSANTARATSAINRFASASEARLARMSKAAQVMNSRGNDNMMKGAAMAAPLILATNAAVDFEKGMSAVIKQMSDTTPKAIEKMRNSVYDLSEILAMPIDQIQALEENALKMGVEDKYVKGFAFTSGKMANAFQAAPEAIAADMAGIATLWKIPLQNIDQLGDKINYLDDKYQSSGADIINVMKRIGGSSRYLSDSFAAALSSTFLTLQETPERTATAINSMVNTLAAAGSESKSRQAAMKALGFEPRQLQKDMVKNGEETILKVLDSISKLKPESQMSAISMLFGREVAPAVSKFINGRAEFAKQRGALNGSEKGSMDKEYSRDIQNAATQIQLFKNSINVLSIKAGGTLVPVLKKVLNDVKPIIKNIVDWIGKNPKLTGQIVKAALAFAGARIALGGLQKGVGGVINIVKGFKKGLEVYKDVKRFYTTLRVANQFNQFARGGSRLTKAFELLKIGFKGVGQAAMAMGRFLLANPIILIAAAIALAAYLIIKNWDKIKPWFIKLWGYVKNLFKKTWAWIKNMFLNYTPQGLIFKHWDTIKGWFGKLWGSVKKIFSAAWEGIKNLFLSYTPHGLIIKHWSEISGFFGKLWDGVKAKFLTFVTWFSAKWKWINENAIKPLTKFLSGDSKMPDVNVNRGAVPQPVPVRSNNSMVYSPTIQIQGNADARVMADVLGNHQREFERRQKEMQHNKMRRAI